MILGSRTRRPQRKKLRVEIPGKVAARVLFRSDRTCCVCTTRGRPVQIHHIDDNPANYNEDNLAVLCLDCHRDTQIKGGFDRKLDASQVRLFRADWLKRVRRRRVNSEMPPDLMKWLASFYPQPSDTE